LTAGWHVEITARARRDLRNLDPRVRARVFDALAGLVGDPPVGDVKKLAGPDAHRLRIGDWRARIRLDHDARVIVVTRVLPRGRAYRD
jgi:mRNA interferase RelE/StbE